ncbi:MAG: hypothetical protein JWN42_2798 [Candidatus Angelobacter sp.]|nr:hypothetical protein [Candidatus Angelobacter sp.]
MESLFPSSTAKPHLVGIARLAAQGEAISEGHKSITLLWKTAAC